MRITMSPGQNPSSSRRHTKRRAISLCLGGSALGLRCRQLQAPLDGARCPRPPRGRAPRRSSPHETRWRKSRPQRIRRTAFKDTVGKREDVRMAAVVNIEVAYNALGLHLGFLRAKHRKHPRHGSDKSTAGHHPPCRARGHRGCKASAPAPPAAAPYPETRPPSPS